MKKIMQRVDTVAFSYESRSNQLLGPAKDRRRHETPLGRAEIPTGGVTFLLVADETRLIALSVIDQAATAHYINTYREIWDSEGMGRNGSDGGE